MSSLYVAICLCKVYENVSGAFKGTALHELEHPSQKVFASALHKGEPANC